MVQVYMGLNASLLTKYKSASRNDPVSKGKPDEQGEATSQWFWV